mgnify:CR=1 FL=1
MSRFSKLLIPLLLSLSLIFTGSVFSFAEETTEVFNYTSTNSSTSNTTVTKLYVDSTEYVGFSESGKKAFPSEGTATRVQISNSKKAARVVYYYAVYKKQANTNAQKLKIQYALTYLHKGKKAVPSSKLAEAKSMANTASKYLIPSYMHFKAYRYTSVEEYNGVNPTFIAYEYDHYKPVIGLTYYNENMYKAIKKFGGVPILLEETSSVERAKKCLEAKGDFVFQDKVDAIIVPGGTKVSPATFGEKPKFGGGDGDPWRDKIDIAYLTAAFEKDMPVLTFCRGIHILNVFAGGTLWQDNVKQGVTKVSHKHTVHSIKTVKGTLLANLIGYASFRVQSNHTGSVRKLGKKYGGAKVAARSPSGVIEAIYFPKQTFALGLQFHPEKPEAINALYSYRIFTKYLVAAFNYHEKNVEQDPVI